MGRREGREAQVLRREANVRWLGRVGWRSMERKKERARGVLAWAEIKAVHDTTLGDWIWRKRGTVKESVEGDLE